MSSAYAPRGPSLGRLASATQLLFAGLLALIASHDPEPGFVPRGAVLFLVFGVPAIVGWLGAVRGRSAILIAAGMTSAIGAFIAFSGVTLIFLIPALLFLFGAVQVQGSSPWERTSIRAEVARMGAAAAILVMLVGAGASALLVTDDTCWTEYHDAAGARIELFPYTTGEIAVPPGATSAACSTGAISGRGVGLAALLWFGALVLAARSSRRPQEGPYVNGIETH